MFDFGLIEIAWQETLIRTVRKHLKIWNKNVVFTKEHMIKKRALSQKLTELYRHFLFCFLENKLLFLNAPIQQCFRNIG